LTGLTSLDLSCNDKITDAAVSATCKIIRY